jgi:molybdopterin-guanine dinucleotide biosynthesis protein A
MQIAGIILAGGLGTRMGHAKKAFIKIGGQTNLDRLLAVYRPLFNEILLSARDPQDFTGYSLPVALDRFEARSSLTGIHAGLHAMNAQHGFFAACDAPFLQPGLVQALLAQVQPQDDIVVPTKTDGYQEPLCAVYSKRCLPFIADQLVRNDFKIINFFNQVRVRQVPITQLVSVDPDLLSFFNVNRPEDLAEAERLAAERGL